MGRPREHDEHTANALLDAAEQIIDKAGIDALSVRGVADEVGTTTRAVYTSFGSKDGLLVALGARAFDLLGTSIRALPETTDPAADLVEAGVTVFRRFAIDHPSLFRIAVQQTIGAPGLREEFAAAATRAFTGLQERAARLDTAGLLGNRGTRDVAAEFHALCEGLAAIELRGRLTPGDGERIWRDALGALVAGFAVPRG